MKPSCPVCGSESVVAVERNLLEVVTEYSRFTLTEGSATHSSGYARRYRTIVADDDSSRTRRANKVAEVSVRCRGCRYELSVDSLEVGELDGLRGGPIPLEQQLEMFSQGGDYSSFPNPLTP